LRAGSVGDMGDYGGGVEGLEGEDYWPRLSGLCLISLA